MATFVVLAGRMIPTEEILKVSSRYLDWFRFYEFFFVKNSTNCPIIGLVPYPTLFLQKLINIPYLIGQGINVPHVPGDACHAI